jgi:hypothetical protein
MMALAPWCVNEKWTYLTADGEERLDPQGCKYAKVTGRTRTPSKYTGWAGFLWWFQNSYEQQLSDAPWYQPDWPQWKRVLYWNYFRNFAQNGNMFVWGVADRNYTVEVLEGVMNPMVVQRNDVMDPVTGKPQEGFQKCRLYDFDDGTPDKFWSAESVNPTPLKDGKQVNSGIQPSGISQVKMNVIKWDTWPFK